jgi:hypothetical protein
MTNSDKGTSLPQGVSVETANSTHEGSMSRSCWRIHVPTAARDAGASAAKRERRVCSRGRSSLQANKRTRLRAQAIIRCCNRVFASPM